MSASHGELFIEIRCEELPARFVRPAVDGLRDAVLGLLKGLDHGPVRTWSTPRRVAVAVAGVPAARPVEDVVVTGPPATSAFRDGVPTRAAEGFARGKGLTVDQLVVVDGPKGPVVAARVRTGGEPTATAIADGLERAVLGIGFPKTMRWGSGSVKWARPIHSVVALLGDEVIDTTIAGVRSGRTTLGHRLSPGPVEVNSADEWVAALRMHNVEADRAARRARIAADLADHAARLGCRVLDAELLLDEVVDLVEWPVVVPARFESSLLALPPRLLIESMRVHQRVFPLVADDEDRLSHHFLVVSNHPPAATDVRSAATIGHGNARVLAARFHDAQFFYAEDRKKPLAAHGEQLATMRWIRGGGTMADKAARIAELAADVSRMFGADPAVARQAGQLAKADLATEMVGEFPELQGHVGMLLAHIEGIDNAIATAIEEHYLPRFAGDALPQTPAGCAVAAADRIDTLAGCFSAGLKPKGGADPLGLRRAANGLLLLVLAAGVRRQLGELIDHAAFDLGGGVLPDLVDFTMARLRAQMMERFDTDLVDAVIATGDTDPVALLARAEAMAALSRTPEFGPLKETFKRVMGVTRDHDRAAYDAAALTVPAEKDLHTALSGVTEQARAMGDALDYAGALAALSQLKAPVDRLFDDVMVMADDLTVRNNRLGLLRTIADAFGEIADFTHLSAEG